MLVFAQVSSTKTRRAGSGRPWNFFHCSRRRAILGRSCSAGRTLFFEAQPLGVNEAPDLNVTDLHAAFGQFGHQSAKREVGLRTLPQPVAMSAGQNPDLMPANLARHRLARSPIPLMPA